jgi:hypothetical protein
MLQDITFVHSISTFKTSLLITVSQEKLNDTFPKEAGKFDPRQRILPNLQGM